MGSEHASGPVAARRRSVHVAHGVGRDDDYDWLRDLADPAVIEHLRRERRHHDRATASLEPFRQLLYGEMAYRTPAAETSVRWQRGGFSYCTRLREGAQYETVHRLGPGGGPEQLVLDPAAIAGSSPHIGLGCMEPSPDGRLLAYSVDLTGEELFELRFRDIESGRELPDRIFPVLQGGAWSAGGGFFFYTVPGDAYRPYQVVRHHLGSPVEDDEVVHEEEDERFGLSVRATRDGEWIVLDSRSRDTTEARLVSARYPTELPRIVALRRPGIEYSVEVLRGGWSGSGPSRLLLVTNDRAPEFRLVEAPVPLPWTGVPGDPVTWGGVERALTSPGERLEDVAVFARHLVLTLRRDGEPFLRVVDRAVPEGDGSGARRGTREVHPGVPHGRLRLWRAEDPDADCVVVVEENLVTAPVWVRIDLATGMRRVLRRSQPPGVDPTRYQTERITAVSADGTPVPVTIARRRDVLPGTAEGCLLYGYGATETCSWPEFSVATLSLLDRGAVYAVAHVRGGGELGRAWWEAARLHTKHRTFEDHLAARDRLVEAGWAGPRGVVTRGRSVGGGLLQGAVFSLAPDRWRAVIAEVPFVDVVTTMSDPSAPRVATEWEEWGDPLGDPQDLAAMLAYSPYDNPPRGPRPPLLVTAALHDPRVLVHEPAKWVARLRATDPARPASPVLLRVELGPQAHDGPSGRYRRLRYEAEILAWALEQLGHRPS